jgi:hypothetical protein
MTFTVSANSMMAPVRTVDSERNAIGHTHVRFKLQANMCGIQWHPRVHNQVGKRAPYIRLNFPKYEVLSEASCSALLCSICMSLAYLALLWCGRV